VDFCARIGPAEVGGIYPPDVFTYKQICDGAWVLHLLGALYMFLALSIVCDEFFVPALEVIVERFKISVSVRHCTTPRPRQRLASEGRKQCCTPPLLCLYRVANVWVRAQDDVAGATFMAAGGSAPELATSLIGTFVAVSDVGFGTIVGSAVFNVLFVIGCCAMLSKELLTLTWWPLARDSLYYSITLACLIGFFIDGQIEWWEAVIQFLLYIGYVIEMAHNVQLYKFTRNVLGLR
jgi:sodium/potassium/calcium exchanger 2